MGNTLGSKIRQVVMFRECDIGDCISFQEFGPEHEIIGVEGQRAVLRQVSDGRNQGSVQTAPIIGIVIRIS